MHTLLTKLVVVFAAIGIFSALLTNYNKEIYVAKLPIEYTTFTEIEKELECLAENIYFEAKGESFEGKLAVAQVTLNRKLHKYWPSEICAVVYQKSIRGTRVTCQFSWYCDGKADIIRNEEQYYYSMVAARKVLLDGFRNPDLTGAYYYHATYVNPRWRKPKLVKIGMHIFYGENT